MITLLLLVQDPCVVLTDVRPEEAFECVVQAACAAAGTKEPLRFACPADALAQLQETRPRYALVVVPPDRLDVNLAYDLLEVATRIDDDPFVDLEYGFITGRTPELALAFLRATEAVRQDPTLIPQRTLEILGPNARDDARVFFWHRATALPVAKGFAAESLNHGQRGYPDAELEKLSGYGLVYIGGHGVPERVEQGLTAAQLEKVDLRHAIVWSGACWTGVTERFFDVREAPVRERRCTTSFCLALLERGVGAYLAALHPDHGMPVMQEVERVIGTACTLGASLKHSHDSLVLTGGGKLRALPRFRDGEKAPALGRGVVEYDGTAARVLFGDPRIKPVAEGLGEAFAIERARSEAELRVVATLRSTALRASLTDTFAGDLGKNPMLFNERAWLEIELDAGDDPRAVEVVGASARGKELTHRLVGFAVEEHAGKRTLHVQVDFAADGFQTSAFRRKGTRLELRIAMR